MVMKLYAVLYFDFDYHYGVGIEPGISNSLSGRSCCRSSSILNIPLDRLELSYPYSDDDGPRYRNPSGSPSDPCRPCSCDGPPDGRDVAAAAAAAAAVAAAPASASSPARTPVRPIRGQKSGSPTTCTRGSTTRSSNHACTRASMSCATLGTSCSRVREPIKDLTERSSR